MKGNTMKTNTPAPKLHTCAVCNETGSCGAKWNFFVNDEKVPKRVHRPCGELLQKSAPEGVRTTLVPSRELRDEWRAKRLAQTFWGNAFANAKPIKAPATSVASPQSAPALAT